MKDHKHRAGAFWAGIVAGCIAFTKPALAVMSIVVLAVSTTSMVVGLAVKRALSALGRALFGQTGQDRSNASPSVVPTPSQPSESQSAALPSKPHVGWNYQAYCRQHGAPCERLNNEVQAVFQAHGLTAVPQTQKPRS